MKRTKVKKLFKLTSFAMIALGVFTVKCDERVMASTTVYEKENNNTKNIANEVSGNVTMVGSITEGDVDYYKYTVLNNGYVKFTARTYDDILNNSYYITIYDGNFKEITSDFFNENNWVSKRLNFKKGTVMYVRIQGYSSYYDYSQDGHYCITAETKSTSNWEVEDNNTKPKATKLSKKVTGTIYNEKDVDFYKYTAPKNGYVKFKFCNVDGVTDTSGWNVCVYDSNFNDISSQYSFSNDYLFGTFMVKKGTVYYLKVSMAGIGIMDHEYTITPVLKVTNYIEKENNNSFGKASTISQGKYRIGALNREADRDYYKFKASKTGTLKINLKIEERMSHGYEMIVYNSNRQEIRSINDVRSGGVLKVKVKKGKSYYVKIQNNGIVGSSWNYLYTLKLSK